MDNITRIEQVTKRHFSEHSRELFKSPYAGIWGRVVRDLGPMGYFLAPASSKFHLSTSGGLLAHSVNVADVALGLARSRFPGQDLNKVRLAALLHDVGKCGLFEEGEVRPRYKKNPEPFPEARPRQQKYWSPFLYEKGNPEFSVRDLSPLYAARWGCPWDVLQAIMLHDGAWDPANAKYLDGKCPLTVILIAADFLSAMALETSRVVIEQRWEGL